MTAHPYDGPARQRTGGEFRRDLMALGEGPPLGQEELTRRWQRLSDRRFGAFAGLDDASFRQLPLKVAVARMSDPCGLLPAPAAVIGVGAARPGARQRAMLLALAAYGSIVVDPRLLVDRDGTFLGPRDGDPAPLLAAVRDRSVDAFVRAIDLTGGQERLIPARRAFPVLRQPGSSGPPCGASAALDWRRALAHGLLQHCARRAVAGGPRPGSVLVAEDFEQDGGVRFAAAMVKAAGVGLTLREITGPAGIAVVAGTLTAGETVYGAGATVTDAVREALTGALFRYQRRRDPALRAVRRAAAPAVWTSPAGSGSLDPDRLARGLADLGYAPSVFALDHDRAVHEAFPYILRVVLTRPPGQI